MGPVPVCDETRDPTSLTPSVPWTITETVFFVLCHFSFGSTSSADSGDPAVLQFPTYLPISVACQTAYGTVGVHQVHHSFGAQCCNESLICAITCRMYSAATVGLMLAGAMMAPQPSSAIWPPPPTPAVAASPRHPTTTSITAMRATRVMRVMRARKAALSLALSPQHCPEQIVSARPVLSHSLQ